MSLLRADLLQGRRIGLAGGGSEEVGAALSALGAELEPLAGEEIATEEERVGEWARAHRPLHALVYSATAVFGAGGEEALLATLEEAWGAVREVAVGALIEAGHPSKVVLLGPRSDAGPYAAAARAGLENLARTLSVEWARYGVTAVTVAAGPHSTERELANLVCFLVSEAGEYLSGCPVALGEVG